MCFRSYTSTVTQQGAKKTLTHTRTYARKTIKLSIRVSSARYCTKVVVEEPEHCGLLHVYIVHTLTCTSRGRVCTRALLVLMCPNDCSLENHIRITYNYVHSGYSKTNGKLFSFRDILTDMYSIPSLVATTRQV